MTEAEYEMLKCCGCGNERQGARLVKLIEKDKPEWNALTKKYKTVDDLLGLSVIGMLFIPLVFIIIPVLFKSIGHIITESAVTKILYVFVCPLILSLSLIFFIMFPLMNNKNSIIKTEMRNFVEKKYGVKPNEPYKIV